jgi:hypothetical protein
MSLLEAVCTRIASCGGNRDDASIVSPEVLGSLFECLSHLIKSVISYHQYAA